MKPPRPAQETGEHVEGCAGACQAGLSITSLAGMVLGRARRAPHLSHELVWSLTCSSDAPGTEMELGDAGKGCLDAADLGVTPQRYRSTSWPGDLLVSQ